MEDAMPGPHLDAVINAGAEDSSVLAAWAESLRSADDALDGPIAAAVRSGETDKAQQLADHASALRACAAFLDKLYAAWEDG